MKTLNNHFLSIQSNRRILPTVVLRPCSQMRLLRIFLQPMFQKHCCMIAPPLISLFLYALYRGKEHTRPQRLQGVHGRAFCNVGGGLQKGHFLFCTLRIGVLQHGLRIFVFFANRLILYMWNSQQKRSLVRGMSRLGELIGQFFLICQKLLIESYVRQPNVVITGPRVFCGSVFISLLSLVFF